MKEIGDELPPLREITDTMTEREREEALAHNAAVEKLRERTSSREKIREAASILTWLQNSSL